jgi:hypothetical protein
MRRIADGDERHQPPPTTRHLARPLCAENRVVHRHQRLVEEDLVRRPIDEERLAQAALWVGEDDESMDANQHAYQTHLAEGHTDRAAHVAAMLVIHHGRRLHLAVAGGREAKLQTPLQEVSDERATPT